MLNEYLEYLEYERHYSKYTIDNYERDIEENKSTVSNVNVPSSNIPVKTNLDVIEEKLGDSISFVPLDDEEDDYEPDDFAFLSPEEREEAYGEGNIDIEEHRRRR